MIHALITGRLHAAPDQRTGKNGQPFTTAKVQVPAGQGRIFASVICFDRQAQQAPPGRTRRPAAGRRSDG